jgi:hypothetical protein
MFRPTESQDRPIHFFEEENWSDLDRAAHKDPASWLQHAIACRREVDKLVLR